MKTWVEDVYLRLVSTLGAYYVYPLGESLEDRSAERRCFTRRGAHRLANRYESQDRFLVECEADSGGYIVSEKVAIWVVERWDDIRRRDRFSPELEDLLEGVTRNLFYGTA